MKNGPVTKKQPPDDRIKFCRYCDGVIEWGTKACPHCGEALEVVKFDDMEFISTDKVADRGRGLSGKPPRPRPKGSRPPVIDPVPLKPEGPPVITPIGGGAAPPVVTPIGGGKSKGTPVLKPIGGGKGKSPPVIKPIGPAKSGKPPVIKPIGPAKKKGPPVVKPIGAGSPPVVQPIDAGPPVVKPIAAGPPVVQPIDAGGPPVVKPLAGKRAKGPPVVKPISSGTAKGPPVVAPLPAEGDALPAGVAAVSHCPVCSAHFDGPEDIGGTCSNCGQAVCLPCLMRANGVSVGTASDRNRVRWQEWVEETHSSAARCPSCGRRGLG